MRRAWLLRRRMARSLTAATSSACTTCDGKSDSRALRAAPVDTETGELIDELITIPPTTRSCPLWRRR